MVRLGVMVHAWRLVTSGDRGGLSGHRSYLPSLSMTLEEFAEDTRLGGPVSTLEGRAAIRQDQDRAATGRILPLGRNCRWQRYRLGRGDLIAAPCYLRGGRQEDGARLVAAVRGRRTRENRRESDGI